MCPGPCSLYYDRVEHRLWLDEVGMNSFRRSDGSTVRAVDMACIPGTICFYAWMRNAPLEADLTLVKDDEGRLAILATTYLSGFGMPTVSKSDSRCFGYRDVTVYVSNYPDYRSSYIIAQGLDGKWGATAYGSFAGKVLRAANTVVSEIGSEIREFRKDIKECCPEFYEARDSLKSQTRRGLEQCRREMHRGFRQGLRGKSYDPTRD